MGKNLFLQAPVFDGSGNRTGGGLGCQGCHRAPEFDIDPASKNNGIIAKIGGGKDLNNTKSPTLHDLFQPNVMNAKQNLTTVAQKNVNTSSTCQKRNKKLFAKARSRSEMYSRKDEKRVEG